jgi:hypothetical protein
MPGKGKSALSGPVPMGLLLDEQKGIMQRE